MVDFPPQGGKFIGPAGQALAPDLRPDLEPDHLFDDQGHGQHDGRPDGREGRKKHGRGGRLAEVGYGSGLHHGSDQAQRAFVDVGQGQQRHHAVRRPDVDQLRHGQGVADDVPMGQHDALGMAGGPRGIDDGGQVLLADLGRDAADQLEGLGPDLAQFHFAVGDQLLQPVAVGLGVDDRKIVDQDAELEVIEGAVLELDVLLLRDEHGLGLGMAQDVMDLRGREIGQDGDGHGAQRRDGEKGDAPVRAVLAEDGHPVAVGDAAFGQERGDLVDPLFERPVRHRLAVIIGQGRAVGVPFGAVGQNGCQGHFVHRACPFRGTCRIFYAIRRAEIKGRSGLPGAGGRGAGELPVIGSGC